MQDNRTTIRPRAHALRTTDPTEMPYIEEDDSYYRPAHAGRSARRYTTEDGQEVIQQGNRRLVIHRGAPFRRRSWLLPVCVGMSVMLGLAMGANAFGVWWTQRQLDGQYGFPRTWQVDEVVGHADNVTHPTHFIFENLHGHVVIIELPGGEVAHARIYSSEQILGDNADSVPITGEFKDVNGDGRVDMIVHMGNQIVVYLNDGTLFKPQQQTAGSNPRHGGSYVPVG